jgi:hypothetical protein
MRPATFLCSSEVARGRTRRKPIIDKEHVKGAADKLKAQ